MDVAAAIPSLTLLSLQPMQVVRRLQCMHVLMCAWPTISSVDRSWRWCLEAFSDKSLRAREACGELLVVTHACVFSQKSSPLPRVTSSQEQEHQIDWLSSSLPSFLSCSIEGGKLCKMASVRSPFPSLPLGAWLPSLPLSGTNPRLSFAPPPLTHWCGTCDGCWCAGPACASDIEDTAIGSTSSCLSHPELDHSKRDTRSQGMSCEPGPWQDCSSQCAQRPSSPPLKQKGRSLCAQAEENVQLG